MGCLITKRSNLAQRSLSRKLLIGFGISLTVVGLATLGVNYRLLQSNLKRQVHQQAQSITQGLEFATEGLIELENTSLLRRMVQNYATLPAVAEIALVAPDGQVVVLSSSNRIVSSSNPDRQRYAEVRPALATVMQTAASQGIANRIQIEIDGKPILAEVLPFSSTLFSTAGERGLVIVLIDLNQIEQQARRTFLTSTLAWMVGAVVMLLLMGFLIRRTVLLPLHRLNQAVAQSKETGSFRRPDAIPVREISFLAKTFDEVFQQLEAYEQLQREIEERQRVEAALRDREAEARAKSEQLETALKELRRTQSQLIQNEKMSGLGQLVAGVAHEINNPVNFIHGNLEHARQYVRDLLSLVQLYQGQYPHPTEVVQAELERIEIEFLSEDFPKLLSSMRMGTERIRDIVLSLRNFSRLDEAECKYANVHEGIDSTLVILQNRLKSKSDWDGIEVVKEYSQLPSIACYPSQLNQVFMNIFVNAIDALEEMNDRDLSEDRSHPDADLSHEPNQPVIRVWTEALESEWVRIHIADNGPGISEAVRSKLFDPFFTTKPVGKGTGLGLAISYQIVVEKHGGRLTCQSSPGQGTEFVIDLPIHSPHPQNPQ